MKPIQLRRAQILFEAAIELPTGERPAFLEEACGQDQELRDVVQDLLGSDASPDEFLREPLVEPSPAAAVQELRHLPPSPTRRIGPYEILGEIGRGGMSTVLLAQNADAPASPEVALKVVRQDLDQPGLRDRFRTEQRILASLDHPLIARLVDAGTTDEGQPYFVMEHVEGVPVSEYCDAQGLPIGSRIELFREVCGAVQYAHQNLVVHRDLKPRNILVDDRGRPKLLDFGIAKLVEPEAAGDPTVASARILTPSYAAPEHFAGRRVTAATDVYSLGVLLYELLCGARPHDWRGQPAHRILERWERTDPPLPSEVASGARSSVIAGDSSQLRDGQLRASARGEGAPAALARRLAGDLDTIALKALRFEPGQRYASVQALDDDLGRHLAGLPVLARPATRRYRLGRFLRRHAFGVANALVISSLLVGLTVVSIVQSRRVERERDAALRQEQRARAVTQFLVEAFDEADPASGLGSTLTAKDLLDRGVVRIGKDLAEQPGVRAGLQHSMGRAYLGLGLFDEAVVQLEGALSLRREHFGNEDPETAETLATLAEALAWRGDLERAEEVALEARELRRLSSGERSSAVGASQRQLAGVALQRGELEKARRLAAEALDIHRQRLGPGHAEVAKSLTTLMEVQLEMGDFAEAEATGRQALTLSREAFPVESLEVTGVLNTLGTTVRALGRYDEAESLYLEALESYRARLGPDHPLVASVLNDLGGLKLSQADYEGAEALHRQAVELFRARLGDRHAHVARGLSNVGLVLMAGRRFDDAEPLFLEALSIHRELFGELHPLVGETYQNLGSTRYLQGRKEASRRALRSALDARRATLGDEHERTGETRMVLGRVERELGQPSEAEVHFRRGLEAFRAARGDDHWLTAIGHMRLAQALTDQGREVEAESDIRAAVRIFGLGEEPSHLLRAAEAQGILGRVLSALGRMEEAEPELMASYEVLRQQKGDAAKATQEARQRLVAFYERWGRAEEASRYRDRP